MCVSTGVVSNQVEEGDWEETKVAKEIDGWVVYVEIKEGEGGIQATS